MSATSREDPRDPGRWVRRPSGDVKVDDRIGALLRQVPVAAPLPSERLGRAWSTRSEPRSASRWLPRAAFASLFLVVNVGVVFGAREVVRRFAGRRPEAVAVAVPRSRPAFERGSERAPRPAPASVPLAAPVPAAVSAPAPAVPSRASGFPEAAAPPRRLLASRAGNVPSPPREPPSAPAPVGAAPAVSAPRTQSEPQDVMPPPAAAPPHESSVVTALRPPTAEADLLAQALSQLRRERDGVAALATLDVYAARFPEGRLRREAAVARVDALLALGRGDGALQILKSLPLHQVGRADELRIIRAELAAAADCAAAVADFTAVLTAQAAPALHERALYGRAACRSRQGDDAGSQRDLREYVRRFPSGRFAADATGRLRTGGGL